MLSINFYSCLRNCCPRHFSSLPKAEYTTVEPPCLRIACLTLDNYLRRMNGCIHMRVRSGKNYFARSLSVPARSQGKIQFLHINYKCSLKCQPRGIESVQK